MLIAQSHSDDSQVHATAACPACACTRSGSPTNTVHTIMKYRRRRGAGYQNEGHSLICDGGQSIQKAPSILLVVQDARDGLT